MALRDVTIEWNNNDMRGGEVLEFHLKVGDEAWGKVGEVGENGEGTQSHLFPDLAEDVEHRLQIRARLSGSYRTGYTGPSPTLWPEQSLLVFTPGIDLSAPTLTGSEWERTSAEAQQITIDVTTAHADRDLELLRNGVVVATKESPHDASEEMVDENPPIGEHHTYTARHLDGDTQGPLSNSLQVFAGLGSAPLFNDFTDTHLCRYRYNFVQQETGADTEVQDNHPKDNPASNWKTRGIVESGTDFLVVSHGVEGCAEPGVPVEWQVRARHRLESFGVVDVSAWHPPVFITLCTHCEGEEFET